MIKIIHVIASLLGGGRLKKCESLPNAVENGQKAGLECVPKHCRNSIKSEGCAGQPCHTPIQNSIAGCRYIYLLGKVLQLVNFFFYSGFGSGSGSGNSDLINFRVLKTPQNLISYFAFLRIPRKHLVVIWTRSLSKKNRKRGVRSGFGFQGFFVKSWCRVQTSGDGMTFVHCIRSRFSVGIQDHIRNKFMFRFRFRDEGWRYSSDIGG